LNPALAVEVRNGNHGLNRVPTEKVRRPRQWCDEGSPAMSGHYQELTP